MQLRRYSGENHSVLIRNKPPAEREMPGACNVEQSTFIYGDVCVSRHVRLVKFRFDQSESTVFSFVDYIYFVGLSIAKYEKIMSE